MRKVQELQKKRMRRGPTVRCLRLDSPDDKADNLASRFARHHALPFKIVSRGVSLLAHEFMALGSESLKPTFKLKSEMLEVKGRVAAVDRSMMVWAH